MSKHTSSTRSLTISGIIAAIYAVMSLLSSVFGIAYGPIQCRFSEALTVLPFFLPEAVPGLFIGCLLANIISPYGALDIVFGSLATLLAAIAVRKLRALPIAASVMPAVFNGLIVGPVVYFGYVRAPGAAIEVSVLLFNMFTVAVGEVVVCCVLGLMLLYALRKLPHRMFE